MKILIGAMRGRSDGDWHQSEHSQRLEILGGEFTNSITSVQKDNYVIEIDEELVDVRAVGRQRTEEEKQGGVMETDVCPSITISAFENNHFLIINDNKMEEKKKKKMKLPPELEGKKFRIRKLTPREVGRLMDCDDEEIDKIEASGLSNSSMYKLYGNSIVTSCIYHIFRKLFIDTGMDVKKGEPQQLTLF